ncbi:MAG: hypothetical protein JW810_12300 [Sedimentisphaerales bacterium]|nr:hypothetical protein [Sedimentisphaerales bacterium]
MAVRDLLVVAKQVTRDLKDALADLGADTTIRPEMKDAVADLRRQRYLAMLLDCRDFNQSDDVLEMVVNIRDIDAQIPILFFPDVGEGIRRQLMLYAHCHWGPMYLLGPNGSVRKFGPAASPSDAPKTTKGNESGD